MATTAPEEKRGNLPGFVRFLRRYMSAWPILFAGLIGPMTKCCALIPVYKDQQNLLAFLTSMYGFLLAAALFYYRPVIAARPNQAAAHRHPRIRAVMMLVPIVLIAASIVSVLRYATLVQTSISSQRQVLKQLVTSDQLGTTEILERTDFTHIPNGNALVMWYLAAFLSAETSLVVMALAEYVESSHD